MRLAITLLGLDLLSIEFTTAGADAEEDYSRDLSGGTLASDRIIETGATDRYMGFTGGWEGDGE